MRRGSKKRGNQKRLWIIVGIAVFLVLASTAFYFTGNIVVNPGGITCSDSDGGRNVLVKGTATKGSQSYTDSCLNPGSVREAYCSFGSAKSGIMKCPPGRTCSDGACVKSGIITPPTQTTNYPAPFIINNVPDVAIVYGTNLGVSILEAVYAGNLQNNLQSNIINGNSLGDILVKDTDIISINPLSSKNLIVLGTPCSNKVIQSVLDLGMGSICNSLNFTSKTGVGPGQFLIQSVVNPYQSGKTALLVVGYDLNSLASAVDYIRTQPFDTTIGKKYVSSLTVTTPPATATQKTCTQTRVLINQNSVACLDGEKAQNIIKTFGKKGGFNFGWTYRYHCVKTIQTGCFTASVCPAGTTQTASVSCTPSNDIYLGSEFSFSNNDIPIQTLYFAGKTYSVELISASDTAATIKVNGIPGEITEGSAQIINGLIVHLVTADETNLRLQAWVRFSPI